MISGNYYFTMDKNVEGGIQTFNYGDDIGFTYTDFTYPTELIANPGDNICTAVLDKLKTALGNYEYFYDVYGNFIFQEIKNYQNTTKATIDIRKINNGDYKVDISNGKSVYDFTDNKLGISFSNTPQYNRIKNDFVIWGTRKTTDEIKKPVRYHLAIDKKPKIGDIFNVYFYIDPEDNLRKAKIPISFNSRKDFPINGLEGVFYLDNSTRVVYKWDSKTKDYVSPSGATTFEFDSMTDFPEEPDEKAIYVDKSTGKMYMWKAATGKHYNEVQEEINNLDKDYEQQLTILQESLLRYQSQLADIDFQLTELDDQYATELFNLHQAEQNYDSMVENIKYCQDKIEENNILIDNYRGLEYYYNGLYNNYMTQAASETNPQEREKILELAQEAKDKQINAVAAQQALITENETYTSQITSNENLKIYWEEKKTTAENILEANGYNRKLQELQNAYDGTKNLIQNTEEQITTLKANYQSDLSRLKYEQKQYVESIDDTLTLVQTTDWRSQLYLQGAAAEALGLPSNYYYAELKNEWPKLYNLTADSYVDENNRTIFIGDFYKDVVDFPWDLDYWLDFIDSESDIGGLSISNIGRRSYSENKDDYNCLFEPEIPDFILIESGQDDTEKQREECDKRGQRYIQISPKIYNQVITGGVKNSCFEKVKELLYDYTSYNNSISIGCLPIYHLDVNQRISIQNQQNDIFGDYLINSISIPLTVNGTMNISAMKCNAKL